jgi:hypothetical protein
VSPVFLKDSMSSKKGVHSILRCGFRFTRSQAPRVCDNRQDESEMRAVTVRTKGGRTSVWKYICVFVAVVTAGRADDLC